MSWTGNISSYYYAGKDSRAFNFQKHNIMQKYGTDWKEAFYQTTAKRLPAWGINTIGNWSAPEICALHISPYVVAIKTNGPEIEGSSGYWGKFIDVFHPDFLKKFRQRLDYPHNKGTVNDPMCIGYFVDNELSWGDETSLAIATLVSPAEQYAKLAFVADLKTKYTTVAALNAAWRTNHASWDALLQSTTPPAVETARPDLEAFTARIANTYFSSIRAALKVYAPHHLYLGCRFMSEDVNTISAKASAQHCDIVSFNIYKRHLSEHQTELAKAGDKPCIIGEFHFGALDRGLFHPGLVPVADQKERAQAFTQFVKDCVAHPNLVGCHWFQYADSPTTGRLWDGENYQIGFTDTCDTPYTEIIEASRALGDSLYTN
jgi:hypothetical protein